jgi:catechol 2,3-dioxygenase-like lactoylglutathione lyase family enzyme
MVADQERRRPSHPETGRLRMTRLPVPEEEDPIMGLPNGVHHLALNTGNMKAQIEFFTDVLGAELKALYWMHGTNGYFHGFLKLNDLSYVAFVQGPRGAEPAGAPPEVPQAAAINHVAFSVANERDLLAMRDRIRDRGVVVIGPIDHGFCKSIYFGGPEGLRLELSTNEEGIDERAWIDPEVVEKCKIDARELAKYLAPDLYRDQGGTVAQPELRPDKPQPMWRGEALHRALRMSDEEVTRTMSEPTPPVQVAPRRAPAMAK